MFIHKTKNELIINVKKKENKIVYIGRRNEEKF